MLKMFRKAFWVPYEEIHTYPTVAKAHQAIAEYCEKSGFSCTFVGADEVVIDGVAHEIYRGLEIGGRGAYGIKCTEK